MCGVETERGVELYIHEHTDISIMWGQRKDKKKKEKKEKLISKAHKRWEAFMPHLQCQ